MVTKLAFGGFSESLLQWGYRTHLFAGTQEYLCFTPYRWSKPGLCLGRAGAFFLSLVCFSPGLLFTVCRPGEERYICWYCWRTFRYPNSLKAHLRFHCVLSSGGGRTYLHHEHAARQGAAPAADGLRLSPKPPASDFAAAAPASTLRPHPLPWPPLVPSGTS